MFSNYIKQKGSASVEFPFFCIVIVLMIGLMVKVAHLSLAEQRLLIGLHGRFLHALDGVSCLENYRDRGDLMMSSGILSAAGNQHYFIGWDGVSIQPKRKMAFVSEDICQ